MPELKETKKIKLVALYEQTKNNLNLTQTIKLAYFLPHKAKKIIHKLGKSKAKIDGDIERECFSAT